MGKAYYRLEGVDSRMYETDKVLIDKYVGICAVRFSHDLYCLDLGTFMGASAILIAQAGPFRIITVDFILRDGLKDNLERHDVSDRIEVRNCPTSVIEWDKEDGICFMLIDASHNLLNVRHDFFYFSRFVPSGGYVAFHDVGKPRWPGILSTINEAVEYDGWRVAEFEGYLCILQKP